MESAGQLSYQEAMGSSDDRKAREDLHKLWAEYIVGFPHFMLVSGHDVLDTASQINNYLR